MATADPNNSYRLRRRSGEDRRRLSRRPSFNAKGSSTIEGFEARKLMARVRVNARMHLDKYACVTVWDA